MIGRASLGLLLGGALLSGCAGGMTVKSGEWPAYARDPGGMRHSPLTQINRDNVTQLELAWTYRTGELATYAGTTLASKAAFEATPLMVDGVLYLSTPTNRVIALDAATGALRWVYDPKLDLQLNFSEVTSRGVALWTDTTRRPGEPGYRLVYVGTIDGRLIALDAATGRPREDFGERGIIDLKVGTGPCVTASTRSRPHRPSSATSWSWATLWATIAPQPFPANLPVFGLRKVTPDDAWGLTPAEAEVGRKRIAGLRYEGPFTPVSLQETIEAPSNTGGFNWGGLSYDPARDIIVGAVNRFAAIVKLYPRDSAPSSAGPNIRLEAELGSMLQTPYVVSRTYLLNFQRGGIPYTKPGTLQFEVHLGFMLDPKEYPEAEQWGSISLGGPMTTAGGLVFIGATRDNHVRAFDIETGRLLWKALLPAGAQATPMTYESSGTQYVVISAGGHGKLGATLGDYVMAFSLPRGRK